jgi:nucleotide-binding universal stress UspA family protein
MASNVLIGLKPDSGNRGLLDLAAELVPTPAKIHLASFVNVGTSDDEVDRLRQVEQWLEKLSEELRTRGYEVETHAQINSLSAGANLARLAEDVGADLMVIGLVKRSRVGKALMGSDAQTAILTAPCAVVSARLT